ARRPGCSLRYLVPGRGSRCAPRASPRGGGRRRSDPRRDAPGDLGRERALRDGRRPDAAPPGRRVRDDRRAFGLVGPPPRPGARPGLSAIRPGLVIGEYPTPEDAAWLRDEHGVTAVVSLQDDADLASKGLRLVALER